jgi:hypothetical protein
MKRVVQFDRIFILSDRQLHVNLCTRNSIFLPILQDCRDLVANVVHFSVFYSHAFSCVVYK